MVKKTNNMIFQAKLKKPQKDLLFACIPIQVMWEHFSIKFLHGILSIDWWKICHKTHVQLLNHMLCLPLSHPQASWLFTKNHWELMLQTSQKIWAKILQDYNQGSWKLCKWWRQQIWVIHLIMQHPSPLKRVKRLEKGIIQGKCQNWFPYV